MVGATLACSLASNTLTRGLRVAMLESQIPNLQQQPPSPDLRVSSISPKSAAVLQSAGCWGQIDPSRVAVFKDMQVWDSFGRGRIHWKASDMHREELGFVIENNVIQAGLVKSIVNYSKEHGCGVEVAAPVRVESIEQRSEAEPPSLALSTGQRVTARLLVGADGGQSVVKKFAKMSAVGMEYSQSAVVATVRTAEPHTTAWQRFLPTGPVAFLPSFGAFSNIVWSTSPAHARHLSRLPSQEFLELLNTVFRAPPEFFCPGGRLSPFHHPLPQQWMDVLPLLFPEPNPSHPPLAQEVIGPRPSFPLRIAQATSYVRPRLALIGDAAHLVHPLAGQGVNIGISDAAALAQSIESAVRVGMDVGDLIMLEEYERRRLSDNSIMLGGVHLLREVFGVTEGPLAWLRTVGLDFFNSVPVAKAKASSRAMGLDTDS